MLERELATQVGRLAQMSEAALKKLALQRGLKFKAVRAMSREQVMLAVTEGYTAENRAKLDALFERDHPDHDQQQAEAAAATAAAPAAHADSGAGGADGSGDGAEEQTNDSEEASQKEKKPTTAAEKAAAAVEAMRGIAGTADGSALRDILAMAAPIMLAARAAAEAAKEAAEKAAAAAEKAAAAAAAAAEKAAEEATAAAETAAAAAAAHASAAAQAAGNEVGSTMETFDGAESAMAMARGVSLDFLPKNFVSATGEATQPASDEDEVKSGSGYAEWSEKFDAAYEE